MRVAVLVKATPESEAGIMPDEKLLAAMTAYNEALHQAGILVSGDGLHPSSRGFRIRFSGDQRTVIDGPFAETKELVAGFWIWEVDSLEHAIEWAKKCPNPMPSDSELEIRKIFDAADFGPEFTPELQAREEQLRMELESRGGN
ncbi:YCII-related domain protein [Pirellula sp. SH-Sr6A]|uniref:YciI family protein n=1 Tax=Pirellula sp. SH-Sr6A TaxID=1632865 RepID=UPI00078E54E7|nr:YciI family protein [Pirellula sp. SH-Sr6A]AMV30608.1 YCII-related domain protein [Pirellula sp. SH-Sr6A]